MLDFSNSIADMGFFEFRRQLEYKAAMRGGQVVAADRFYPSSKMCSACGDEARSIAAIGARVDMPIMRRGPRPRPERGGKSEEHAGEFHRVSLWRGRRWPRSQVRGETGLGEAGSKRQIES